MTVADEDNPMLSEARRKKLKEEKKHPLRPLTAKELKEAFGHRTERIGIKVSPYVTVRDMNHSSEDHAARPKPAI